MEIYCVQIRWSSPRLRMKLQGSQGLIFPMSAKQQAKATLPVNAYKTFDEQQSLAFAI